MNLIATSQLTVVIGLGMTGLSVARFLRKNNQRFVMMDSREAPPNIEIFKQEFGEIDVYLGELDKALLRRASEVVISPGVSLRTPALKEIIASGVSVVGDVELFARAVTKPVIAITGSNAKSTVTTLVGEMAAACGLSVAVGGNVGVPVLDLLDRQNIDIFVLELSSFQLESTSSLKPIAATILNVSHDHMDRYESIAEYHQAKQRIYRHAQTVVINRQDALTHPPLSKEAKVISFGNDSSDMKSFGFIQQGDAVYLGYQFKPLVAVESLTIKGRHNHLNALAALALGVAAGFEMQCMLAALISYKGLPHRCEYIATLNGAMYINDSKATNVGATLAAIEGFAEEKNIILLAGGESKGADFSPLLTVATRSVKLTILIGRDADKLYSVLSDSVNCLYQNSLVSAVQKAMQHAENGDVILLSPACASFDMFTGFEDRGRQFMHAVKALAV
ncbi:MAG: UDP-N-acetylmuramoylalanine--D-glutamate ligase [Candidatus Endobugula sp.]|jgi:UDP-N-acetylmuramoylalanine--D-glutamate ligase